MSRAIVILMEKVIKILNLLLVGWILSIFLYKPFLNLINCNDIGWQAIRNFECGNVAYIYDIFANTFLFIVPFLLLPITITVWLFIHHRSKRVSAVHSSIDQPKNDFIGAIKVGLALSLILLCAGFIYLASQWSSG